MKKGYGIFGKPYEIMLRNDLHDEKSIDHELMRNMVLLDKDSFKYLYNKPVCPNMSNHELYDFAQRFKAASEKLSIRNILDFTSGMAERYDVDFAEMLFGGTEKQILERETDWCADMARVGCVLLQCIGIPCRILHLANLDKAYNGHVAGEAYYENHYGIVDFIYGYQFYGIKPIDAHEVTQNAELLNPYPESYRGLFSAIGISEYDPTNGNNSYIVSTPNKYYMNLIYANHNDTWIMGEDNE